MKISSNAVCPCKSGRKYKRCCLPLHRGASPATPEALMRSRYAAYALNNPRYIIKTTHPVSSHRQTDIGAWHRDLEQFSETTHFTNLEILSTEEDTTSGKAWVTFRATLFQDKTDRSFTEKSLFEQVDGQWKYVSGEIEN
ncbi:MAG: YchJ family metal-binding protein [Chloroflexota bacterium]